MSTPKIRIKKSFLLNDKVIPLLKVELKAAGREEEAREEFIDAKVKAYQDAWSKYETKILSALCDALGVEFNQNIIDVYVAPFSNSFSDPMVISTKYSPDRAVEVLTHEISHRLLTDNIAMPMKDGRKPSEHWRELFGEHDFRVLTHIPVHALLQYVFIDILNEPYRLERDVNFCSKHEPYRLAWEYVQKVGYTVVIEQLRESYKAK
jgi:hypothetical protein